MILLYVDVCETEEQAERTMHTHTHKCSTPLLQTHSSLNYLYCRQRIVATHRTVKKNKAY